MKTDKRKEKSYWNENAECAMIEIQRGPTRRFFTDKANLPYLVEFSRTCMANLAIVKIKAADIWPLRLLVEKINDANYNQQDVQFELIKLFEVAPKQIILPPEQKVAAPDRKRILEEIHSMFLNGEVVSLNTIANRYPAVNRSTLRHYLSRIRTSLFFDGYEIEIVGRGQYATHDRIDVLTNKIDQAAAAIKQAETSVTLKS